jgi:DNA-binding CsgD family transcriptional regulator
MGPALIVLITVNLLLFSGLSAWAWRYAAKETSPRLRLLSRGLSVVSLAFVLGAATRLAGVAVGLGWLPGRVAELILSNWHLLQSLASLALGFGVISVARRVGPPMRSADRIASAVSEHLLGGADLERFDLTPREIEVVQTIAAGYVSDVEIAELLYIAPATAGTHVKNILRKTGMRSRRDLALLVLSNGNA